MSFDTKIPKHLVDALSVRNIVRLLPDPTLANAATFALREAVEAHPGFITDASAGNCLFGFSVSNGQVIQGRVSFPNDGNRRLQIALNKFTPLGLGDIYARIDIPLPMIARGAETLGKYTIYNIRFSLNGAPGLDFDSSEPLRRGYVGITKRSPFERYKEHQDKARKNTGSLLHTAWHAILAAHPRVYPVFQICGHAETLEQAYAAEEELVARGTLAPQGLNAIPGGMAGIQMLHTLGALAQRGKIVSLTQRDRALEAAERNAPATHYRRAHVRRLTPERTTFVNGCWVNVKPAAGAE
jgi:hypothetical protein